MSKLVVASPSFLAQSMFHRFSLAQYHKLTRTGVLTEDDEVELIEGYVVRKMARNPPHCNAFERLTTRLFRLVPAGWRIRIQMAATLNESEPEPDALLARGDENTFAHRHPEPPDIGLVVEVSDSTLGFDRVDKGRVYAAANLLVYWIINVIDRQVEVYTDPRPNDPVPAYAIRSDYKPGDSVPFILDGQLIAHLPVSDLLG